MLFRSKTLESQARTEQLGDIKTVAESSAVATLMPDGKILCVVVHREGVEEVHEIDPSYACLLVDSNMSLVLCPYVQSGKDRLVHAIFRRYLSCWEEKYKNNSACMITKSDEIRSGSSYSSFQTGKKSFHKTANSFRCFAWRPPDEQVCMNIKHLGMVGAFCFQTESGVEINLQMIPEDTFGDNRTTVLFKHLAGQEDLEINKVLHERIGKER